MRIHFDSLVLLQIISDSALILKHEVLYLGMKKLAAINAINCLGVKKFKKY